MSNTKEAEAFALVSEEGIAKGVRRVTALTMGAAKEAIHQSEVFSSQIDKASKLEGPALEKVGCCPSVYDHYFCVSLPCPDYTEQYHRMGLISVCYRKGRF